VVSGKQIWTSLDKDDFTVAILRLTQERRKHQRIRHASSAIKDATCMKSG
jgi:hypothetical protein